MKRWTNQALLVLLGVAFTTGWVAFFYGTAPSRVSLVLHASSGYAAVALSPWKAVIASRGIRRRRGGWWLSLLFSLLVAVSVLAGILHSTGLLIGLGPVSAMEVHVGAALAALPLGLWHVLKRWIRPRATDLSRRSLLRTGTLALAAASGYGASELAVRLLSLPGATRRFTGSYEFGSLQAASLPVTQWLFDPIPVIGSSQWVLKVSSPHPDPPPAPGEGIRTWSYEELSAFDDRVRATLDCTGGFYSTQDWSGVWLSRLIPAGVTGSSLHVRSATGYDRRFPFREASKLLLATRLGGEALAAGHGFPVRLVAPSYRGYWWVKWVIAISIDEAPAWWQLPFPAQ
jgi:DMSO/TMAO reductase YedYZ molybdopterin-dependent catalytic subunit